MSERPSTSQTGPGQDHNLPVFTVSEISNLLKRAVEDRFPRVRIRGEVSGFKRAQSGHLYFTLKDEDAVLDGVCWRGTAGRLGLRPEDGMEVVATGRLTTYAQRSRYQIVVESMELAGEGALLKLLEERRRKLAEEGLFDPDRKKPLPFLPDVIGVVTSPTGAVIRDILHRLADRFPRRVLLWPVTVQGEGAAEEVVAAIRGFNKLKPKDKVPRPDILIVARGGGSLEDLWAFNEEAVVRAAAASRIPLISAVGHETDITLIDFAADARAPTPTAAAEMAVPVRADLVAAVDEESARLVHAGGRLVADARVRLEALARGLPDLARLADELGQRLDDWTERLTHALDVGMKERNASLQRWAAEIPSPAQRITHAKNQIGGVGRALVTATRTLVRERGQALKQAALLLESASYERVLERGFVLVADEARRPVVSIAGLASGMGVGLRFNDGEARATVESVKGGGRGKSRRPNPKPKPGPGGPQGSLL